MVSGKDGYPPEVLDGLERLGFAVERRPREEEKPEKPAKRGRGRPRLDLEEGTPVEQDTELGLWWCTRGEERVYTRRHVLNLSYVERARAALEDERYEDANGHLWPLERVLEEWRCSGTTVLAELGRHGSPEEIVASCRALIEGFDPRHQKATDALRWLRKRRLGTTPRTAHEKNDLGAILWDAVYDYRERYPDLPPKDILDPIARVWAGYRKLLLPDADKEK